EYKYVTDKIHEFQTRMERKRSQEESMQFNQASDYRPVRDSSKEPTLTQNSMSSTSTLTPMSAVGSLAASTATSVSIANGANHHVDSTAPCCTSMSGPAAMSTASAMMSSAPSTATLASTVSSAASYSSLSQSSLSSSATLTSSLASTAASIAAAAAAAAAELQLRAQLPMNQHTTVPIRPGATVRDLLEKKLTTRSLKPEDCRVYIKETRTPVQWDADATELAQQQHLKIVELVVESKNIDSLAKRKLQSYHTFQRKTFFTTIVYCCKCSKILFSGFRCQTCQARYHQRCCDSVLYMPCPVNSGQPHLQGSARYPDVDGLNVVQNFGQNDPSMLLHNHHHHHRNVGGAAAYRHRGGGGHQPHYPTHSAAAAAAAAAAKTHRERSSSAPNVSNLSVNVSRQDGGKVCAVAF
uniref:Phorbol-ester/DAG-type domain-containing protein n=1 Tax=Macrostomum lignano TaxID=282301 RepID=A0A1I8HCX6_9PLAT